MTSGAEHAQKAVELLASANEMISTWQAASPADQRATISQTVGIQSNAIAAAQAHALLAQVQYLREIGDYLGALPVLPMRVEGDGTHLKPLRARYQRADPAEPEVQF